MNLFAKNESNVERTIRVVVGLVLLAGYFFIDGPMRYGALIGVIPLLTGLLGSCPIYSLIGFSTCPTKHKSS